MTPLEERWADAALRAFLDPTANGLVAAADEVDYVACVRRMRRESTGKASFGIRVAVWLVALAPLWLWGKLSTIVDVPIAMRPRLMRELLSHRSFVVRELTMLLKLVMSMALLGVASVRARSRYDIVPTRSRPKTRLPIAS